MKSWLIILLLALTSWPAAAWTESPAGPEENKGGN